MLPPGIIRTATGSKEGWTPDLFLFRDECRSVIQLPIRSSYRPTIMFYAFAPRPKLLEPPVEQLTAMQSKNLPLHSCHDRLKAMLYRFICIKSIRSSTVTCREDWSGHVVYCSDSSGTAQKLSSHSFLLCLHTIVILHLKSTIPRLQHGPD